MKKAEGIKFKLYSTIQREPTINFYTHIHTNKCLFKQNCDYTEHITLL